MMEGRGGASVVDLLVRDGRRQSVFRSYVFPYMDRPNLTVLPNALVTRLLIESRRAVGVEISRERRTHRLPAHAEATLSLGASPAATVTHAIWHRRPGGAGAPRNPRRAASTGGRAGISRPSSVRLCLGISGPPTAGSCAGGPVLAECAQSRKP